VAGGGGNALRCLPLSVVFVTGGSGFIGGRLIERLRADGHTVRALARSDQAGVRRFVHVGTEAALLAGEPLVNVDETAPLRRGVDPPTRSIPSPLARALALAGETAWRTLPLPSRPPLTRFAYWISSQECTIRIDKAREQLGYRPVRSIPDGLQELRSAA
jgi:nucleoside-diphosphate-sugar epimerase